MMNEERDRAIRELQNSINVGLCPDIESRKVAIKALSQQAEDSISRSVQPKIVRCKDCKHREAKNGFCEGRGWPMQLVPDDGFCEKGAVRHDKP